MSSENAGRTIADVLLDVGYHSGRPARREQLQRKLLAMGISVEQIEDLVWFSVKTADNPCSVLREVLEGSGDIKDAVEGATRARRSWGDLGGKNGDSLKARELDIRERELKLKEAEEERRRRAEAPPSYYDDPKREKNALRRYGYDPLDMAELARAYRDNWTLTEIGYWSGLGEVDAARALREQGIDVEIPEVDE